MVRPELEGAISLSEDFYRTIGKFHVLWASADLSIDFAIGKFLELPPEDTHLLTAGMLYGRKLRLLSDLIKRNKTLDEKTRTKFLQSIKLLLGAKRDVITHSYIWSSGTEVKFYLRKAGGEKFTVQESRFTRTEFNEHAKRFEDAALRFDNALGASPKELSDFANAALSLDRKSNRSPAKSADKK
jgi:hypothetical protein